MVLVQQGLAIVYEPVLANQPRRFEPVDLQAEVLHLLQRDLVCDLAQLLRLERQAQIGGDPLYAGGWFPYHRLVRNNACTARRLVKRPYAERIAEDGDPMVR